MNKLMNQAIGATVCLEEISLGKSAGGATETAGGREQGSMNSFRHSSLKCPALVLPFVVFEYTTGCTCPDMGT